MNDSVKNETVPLTADTQTEATITSTVSSTPKKLEVVSNWRKVLLTWSFWLHMGSVILTFVDQLLPFLGLLEPTMTTQTYALLMFTFNGLGLFARFIKQRKLWEYKPGDKDNVQ